MQKKENLSKIFSFSLNGICDGVRIQNPILRQIMANTPEVNRKLSEDLLLTQNNSTIKIQDSNTKAWKKLLSVS